MEDWYKLEKLLTEWLSAFSSNGLEYRNPYQAIVGFPTSGFRSDGMLTDGTVLLALEVEAGQMHPDTNVGKYWLLSDEHKKYSKIILFHIFTPAFNSYEWRMRLALFLANKMKDALSLEYRLFDFRKEKDFDKVVDLLKFEIERTIKKNFK